MARDWIMCKLHMFENKEAIIQAELQGVATKKLRNTKFEYLDQAML